MMDVSVYTTENVELAQWWCPLLSPVSWGFVPARPPSLVCVLVVSLTPSCAGGFLPYVCRCFHEAHPPSFGSGFVPKYK